MPVYTNKKGLSASWVKAAQMADESYDKVGWRSITTLIDSPRCRLLQERHDKEITVDVSEVVFQILGSCVHHILELAAEPDVITEKRILVPILGKEISMKADRIEPIAGSYPQEWHGKDYKVTKVWAWKYGAKDQQIAQANCYRLGYHVIHKLNITKWSLEMLLKDWSKLEAEVKETRDYPSAEVELVPINDLWDYGYTEQYLMKRVKLYEACEKLADDDLPLCTDSERWARPERFAVRKIGGKRALRCYETQREALADLANRPAGECRLEHRPGEQIRCDGYCKARPFCNQANNQLKDDF